MAKSKKKTIRVFYSWQSDLKANRYAIRDALEAAAAKINAERPGIEVRPDEATRDESGAVNIAHKILEKIARADVFIADITTVTPTGASRPCPNPNVLIELGYALGELGWERMILMFNESIGDLKSDLPFDIVQNRVSTYKLASGSTKGGAKSLEALVRAAVEAVIANNPKRPAELRGLTPERIRHDRDVEAMLWLMSNISLSMLDEIIEELPRRVMSRAFWFYESAKGVVASSRFQLSDPVLQDAVTRLMTAWERAFSHGEQYHQASNMQVSVFANPGDAPLSRRQQAAWDDVLAARNDMAQAKADLLRRLGEAYLEIDVGKTSDLAWKRYRKWMRDADRRLSGKSKKKKVVKAKRKAEKS